MSTFQVLFSGEVIEGAKAEQVQRHLARELGLPEQKARQLFSGRTVVIRSQLSEEQAAALVQRLADLGAVCRSKGTTKQPPNPARYKLDEQGADKTLRDLTAAHLECPRCGNLQLLAEHCSRCGVDIDAAIKQKRKEDAIIEKKIKALREQRQAAFNASDAAQAIRTEDRSKPSGGWLSRLRRSG